MKKNRKLGIVGAGPRGSYALERFIIELSQLPIEASIQISVFEKSGKFGNGQVYDLHQNPSNWINISERALELKRRDEITFGTISIPAFPSYPAWAGTVIDSTTTENPDSYPPRSKIGDYLAQRFHSLASPLIENKIITIHSECIEEVSLTEKGHWSISSSNCTYDEFDEILLSIGHQPTELSTQLSKWKNTVRGSVNSKLFISPYPTFDYLQHLHFGEKYTIGIRGFGLSMIDVARAIALRLGIFTLESDTTKSTSYKLKQVEQLTMIPFSLEGLPPVPKPLNAKVDSYFEPSSKSLNSFQDRIGDKDIQRQAKGPQFILDAFAPIAADIFLHLPGVKGSVAIQNAELEALIKDWFEDQETVHPLMLSPHLSVRGKMQEYVNMAIGQIPTTIDYCIGQVWRHCQPTMYRALAFNSCSAEVIAEIIELDESTKRLSYGSPVESIQQILALIDAGILDLDFIEDPDIEVDAHGWHFQDGKKTTTANFMINSVLDPPQIKSVQSSLVQKLLSKDFLEVVHDELGVETDENGYIISNSTQKLPPIALLGRLAKGTVLGTDAILECFGPQPQEWARRAAMNCLEDMKS